MVKDVKGLKNRRLFEEGLLALGDLGEDIPQQEYAYGELTDEQYQAWRERTAWGLKLEAEA
jgi:hypothetical protein